MYQKTRGSAEKVHLPVYRADGGKSFDFWTIEPSSTISSDFQHAALRHRRNRKVTKVQRVGQTTFTET